MWVAILCRIHKEPAVSANNGSGTSSADTCSFSMISLSKIGENRFLESALKSLFYTNYKQACSPTVVAATAFNSRFALKTEQFHTFL